MLLIHAKDIRLFHKNPLKITIFTMIVKVIYETSFTFTGFIAHASVKVDVDQRKLLTASM